MGRGEEARDQVLDILAGDSSSEAESQASSQSERDNDEEVDGWNRIGRAGGAVIAVKDEMLVTTFFDQIFVPVPCLNAQLQQPGVSSNMPSLMQNLTR
jgi:hypothetical protein